MKRRISSTYFSIMDICSNIVLHMLNVLVSLTHHHSNLILLFNIDLIIYLYE